MKRVPIKRILILSLTLVVMALTISTCQHAMEPAEEEQSATSETTPSATPAVSKPPAVSVKPSVTPTAQPEPADLPENPLTGLTVEEDISANRPVAIMINNKREAQPQLGVSKADIIYEVPVEGGITRMMAVFQDVEGAGVIGSVRSSRPYFLDLAQGHDAVYIHAGGSPQAYTEISRRKMTTLDGVNGSRQHIFFRDSARRRTMGYEHSLVTSDELILEFLPQYNFRLTHDDGYEYDMRFADDAVPPGGKPTEIFDVYFVGSKKTSFEYNAVDKTYNMDQQGGPYKDGNTDELLAVTNVIVIRTQIGVIRGDSEGRLSIDLTGGGDGYFMCGGKYIPIRWSKKSETSQLVYTLEDGTPLTLGRGQSYVCIIPTGAKLDIIGEK